MSAFANYDAEVAVIGSMLQDDTAILKAGMLTKDDFTQPEHQSVFLVCTRLRNKGKPVDLITVGNELKRLGSEVTTATLLDAIRRVPTTANVDTYINIVKDASRRRTLSDLGKALVESAGDGGVEIDSIVDAMRSDLRAFSKDDETSWMSSAELASRTMDWLEVLKSGKRPVVKTGIAGLDWLIGGFYPGELEIIGARPGVGKSAFALQIILSAVKQGKKVALVSQEMSPEAVGERIASNLSGVCGSKLHKDEGLEEEEWAYVGEAMNILASNPIYSRYSVRSVEHLWRYVQSLYDKSGLDMLVVDYLQLVHSERKSIGRTDEVEYVSNTLKQIAMELHIPVVALAQVRRSGSREAIMPVMDELKGSGALEQDASKIILLHRPESEDDPYLQDGWLEVKKRLEMQKMEYIVANVAKHREGETGKVDLAFDPEHMRFSWLDE